MLAEPRTPWVVFAAGGALETAFLPKRIFDLRADRLLRTSVAVSRGALEFVTKVAMAAVSGGPIYEASAELDGHGVPLHTRLSEADLLVLHPATGRILAESALGIVSCAVTRLFAFTPKDRIVVAPALHPNMDRRIYDEHLKRLRGLGCTVLGGEDAFASWAEVESHIVARLSLAKRPTSPRPVLLSDLVV